MVDLTLSGQQKRAEELVRAGELEAAGELCRRILELYPKYIGAYSVLGQVCLQVGEHEVAANLFRRVLGADPEDALSYASLGAIYEERGLLDEAIWQLERAVELSPTNEAMREALYDLYDEHDVAYRSGIKMTCAALGRTYLRGGLYAKAMGEFREIVSQKPYRFDLRVALAQALWQDRRREEAEVVCIGILQELPHCLKANLILGQIYFNTEQDDEARAMLQKAQALDPENRVAQSVLGPHSALPRRRVRLPFDEEDTSWELPPYLLEGEQETEMLTIDLSANELPPSDGGEVLLLTKGAPSREAGEGAAASAGSLWLQEGLVHLSENPGDHAARLDLARRLSSMGKIDQAVAQYGQLAQQDDEALLLNVMEDLTLLNRWHSGHKRLVTVLLEARDHLERLEATE